uniref:Protein Wnt n=1 Tax=Heterorhabditis bacteriophora TaxID=37862 RepID=A0A1I7XDF7_HETBA
MSSTSKGDRPRDAGKWLDRVLSSFYSSTPAVSYCASLSRRYDFVTKNNETVATFIHLRSIYGRVFFTIMVVSREKDGSEESNRENKEIGEFCRKNPDMMESVRYGAQNAYAECQFQFHKRRWNCTLIDPLSLELISDVILREGTRESAFVHAVSAAGVAYRVTRDCARGLNERCGCDQSMMMPDVQSRSYDYQGCSDNIQYGIAISREFVDAAEKNRNVTNRSVINLHNNRAGRQVGS